MLIHYPPKVSLAKLVNSLKGVSSRRLRRNLAEEEITKVSYGLQAILLAHVVELRSIF